MLPLKKSKSNFEQLLEDSSSFEIEENNPFHYKNKIHGLFGRGAEVRWIDDFANSPAKRLIRAVFGTGGSSKSKLLSDYCNSLNKNVDSGWRARFLTNVHLRIASMMFSNAIFGFKNSLENIGIILLSDIGTLLIVP